MPFDTLNELKAGYELALNKREQGKLIEAFEILLEIFTYRLLHTQLSDADLKIIKTLADLAGVLEEFSAADDLLYSVISLYEDAGSEYWADYTRLRRMQLCLDSGNLHQAKELLQQMSGRIGNIDHIQFSTLGLISWEASCSWRDTDSQDRIVLFAECYLAMGRLLLAFGQYDHALVALHKGLSHTETPELPSLAEQTIIPLKLGIATANLEKGNFLYAYNYLDDLYNQLAQIEYPEYLIRCYELSGKLCLLQGELGQGLKHFQKVQQMCGQFGLQLAQLRSTLNLAHILILLNQTSTAQNYLIDACVDASAIGNSALVNRAELLLSLAQSRSRSLVDSSPASLSVTGMLKDKNQSPSVTPESAKLDLSHASTNFLTWFEDRVLAFQWQLGDSNLKMASKLLKQIQAVFQHTDSQLIQIQIRVLAGMLAYYQGVSSQRSQDLTQIRQANQILEAVCPQLQQLGLKPELWQVQRILGWCRASLNYPVDEQETLTASTNQLLAQITASLAPEDQVFYLLNKWTTDEEYIATELNQLQRMQRELHRGAVLLRPWRNLKLMQRLNTLVEHIDRYKDVLAKRTITGNKITVPFLPPASLWLRLITHPKDRVTLTFLILPDRILIVITGRWLLDFRVIPTTRLEVRNQVKRWYECINRIYGIRDINAEINIIRDMNFGEVNDSVDEMLPVGQVGYDVAHKLAEILDIPKLLDSLPHRIRALTIVPDDILHGFPFAAIRYKGKYLIENYALAIAYDSQGRRSPNQSKLTKEKALLVGVSQGNHQFPSLAGVKQELHRVNNWLVKHKIYPAIFENHPLNQPTLLNKAAVLESLSQVSLLHIACHGIFELNRPDQSGLVIIRDNGEQEILSLRELSEINLTKLRHATLSCCWSADHFIFPGRWIISLPETLWRSGTHSILGCLWPVHDYVAVPFMTRFYEHLNQHPRDRALQLTQLECLQNSLPNCSVDTNSTPFFWAGFNLYGDYTPLRFSLWR